MEAFSSKVYSVRDTIIVFTPLIRLGSAVNGTYVLYTTGICISYLMFSHLHSRDVRTRHPMTQPNEGPFTKEGFERVLTLQAAQA